MEMNIMSIIDRKKGKMTPQEAERYKKYLADYDRESFVYVDGLLVEPLNPSFSITKNKYYFTKKLRD